jgi:hypothetical protein
MLWETVRVAVVSNPRQPNSTKFWRVGMAVREAASAELGKRRRGLGRTANSLTQNNFCHYG